MYHNDNLERLMKGMILLAALLLWLLAMLPVPAVAEEAVTAYVLVEDGTWLNVRDAPKPHADVTIRLTRGDKLLLCAVDARGWAQVDRAGDPGYCRIEYLCNEPPQPPVTCVATADRLRVRALPNERAETLRKLRKGDTVDVLGVLTVDGIRWARVEDGFVMAKYMAESEQ